MNIQLLMAILYLLTPLPSGAAEPVPHHHEVGQTCERPMSDASGFEGVQIETSAIQPYEQLLEEVLAARIIFKVDHPHVDLLRGYCYRGVQVVVRQDLKTPRPTGWVQLNFVVPHVGTIKDTLEQAVARSSLRDLNEEDRAKIVRIRLKTDVPRSNCRVNRLEVYGPEGLLFGFNEVQPGTCTSGEGR